MKVPPAHMQSGIAVCLKTCGPQRPAPETLSPGRHRTEDIAITEFSGPRWRTPKLGSIRIGHNLSNAFRSDFFQYDFVCNETFQHSNLEVIISAR